MCSRTMLEAQSSDLLLLTSDALHVMMAREQAVMRIAAACAEQGTGEA
jgi:hypothetical protein